MRIIFTKADLVAINKLNTTISQHLTSLPIITMFGHKVQPSALVDEIELLSQIKETVDDMKSTYFTADTTLDTVKIDIDLNVLDQIARISKFQLSAAGEILVLCYPIWVALKRLSISYAELLEDVVSKIRDKA